MEKPEALSAEVVVRGGPPRRETEILLAALRALSSVRTLEGVMAIVRRAARELTHADGVTFVLREGTMVHYADEDAIAPLWKGRRFPMNACISGWVMANHQTVVIEDVFDDPRIPRDLYRPTFVRSMAMVPIRLEDPLGAIGAYWASTHLATPRQIEVLDALAAAAALGVANADLAARVQGVARLRDEFISLAAHELATPFAALRLRAEAFGRGRTEAAASAEELARLRATVERLGDVIGALGEFSRASREGITLERSVVDLEAIARVAAERVRSRAHADETATPVTVTAPWPVIGEWDGRRLEQALVGLLENAVKFGQGSPVEVTVREVDGQARVSVRDHGPGIPPEDRERIFDRFERASSPRNHGGLGLGLWMARAIAEAHGGALAVESAPGAGATFTLMVPRRLPVGS